MASMGLKRSNLPIHQRKSPAFLTVPVRLTELHRARCARVGGPMGHVSRSQARSKRVELTLALLALRMHTRAGRSWYRCLRPAHACAFYWVSRQGEWIVYAQEVTLGVLRVSCSRVAIRGRKRCPGDECAFMNVTEVSRCC